MNRKGYLTPALSSSTLQEGTGTSTATTTANSACIGCRKRKLKCDRQKPKCGTCSRMRNECSYLSISKNVVMKRRSIKHLEGRLAHLETKLRLGAASLAACKESDREHPPEPREVETGGHSQILDEESESDQFKSASSEKAASRSLGFLGLSVQEPPPPKPMQEELFQIYFDKVHPHMPMIHQSRFLAALKLGSNQQPPLCLQYAIWCLAASISRKYESYCNLFYGRARKYSDAVEWESEAKNSLSIYYAQCWHLIATYEAQTDNMTRTWMSAGRCVRLVQMMGLLSIDDSCVGTGYLLPPTQDPIELEERRRTFWAAYFGDRWVSARTGWPMSINESEIFTKLPKSEISFEQGVEETSPFLSDVLNDDGASRLVSPLGGLLLAATLFGRIFAHLHNSTKQNDPQKTKERDFWSRHRELDNILSATFMNLPENLKVSEGSRDLNIFFLYMSLHTSVICLHKAGVIMAMKHRLELNMIMRSFSRCVVAADEITTLVKMISHHDVSTMSPWTGFALYIAGRIYCHDVIIGAPTKAKSQSNLEFLLVAMKAIEKVHHSIRPFTVQLESEFQSSLTATGCQVTRAIRGILSSTNTNDPYHDNNFPPDDNRTPRTIDSEDSDTGSYANSPTPGYTTKPPLPGILLELDPDEKNCPWMKAANDDTDQGCTTNEITSTYSASLQESLQKNDASASQSRNSPAHSSSTSSSQQNRKDFMMQDARMGEYNWFHDVENNASPLAKGGRVQTQAQPSIGFDKVENPSMTHQNKTHGMVNDFQDALNNDIRTQYRRGSNRAMQPDSSIGDQSRIEQELQNFQGLFPYSLNGGWDMPIDGIVPDDFTMEMGGGH